MSKWLVKLKGEEFDLQDLTNLLNSFELKIIKDEGNYYLDSSEFNSLTLKEEVRERGRALIKLLNSVSNFEIGGFRDFSDDGVLFIDDEGKRKRYVFVEAALELTVRTRPAKLTVHDSKGKEIDNSQPSLFESYLNIAQKHQAIVDALVFFKVDTWFNLFKVYEIIKDDIGNHDQMIQNGWVSRAELSRFTQTAQSRAVLGELARHASKKYKPPTQPMSHKEAKSLIKKLLSQWIESKK